eukprot:jgi/Botrbrau1/21734/Bobra.43_1s0128.1
MQCVPFPGVACPQGALLVGWKQRGDLGLATQRLSVLQSLASALECCRPGLVQQYVAKHKGIRHPVENMDTFEAGTFLYGTHRFDEDFPPKDSEERSRPLIGEMYARCDPFLPTRRRSSSTPRRLRSTAHGQFGDLDASISDQLFGSSATPGYQAGSPQWRSWPSQAPTGSDFLPQHPLPHRRSTSDYDLGSQIWRTSALYSLESTLLHGRGSVSRFPPESLRRPEHLCQRPALQPAFHLSSLAKSKYKAGVQQTMQQAPLRASPDWPGVQEEHMPVLQETGSESGTGRDSPLGQQRPGMKTGRIGSWQDFGGIEPATASADPMPTRTLLSPIRFTKTRPAVNTPIPSSVEKVSPLWAAEPLGGYKSMGARASPSAYMLGEFPRCRSSPSPDSDHEGSKASPTVLSSVAPMGRGFGLRQCSSSNAAMQPMEATSAQWDRVGQDPTEAGAPFEGLPEDPGYLRYDPLSIGMRDGVPVPDPSLSSPLPTPTLLQKLSEWNHSWPRRPVEPEQDPAGPSQGPISHGYPVGDSRPFIVDPKVRIALTPVFHSPILPLDSSLGSLTANLGPPSTSLGVPSSSIGAPSNSFGPPSTSPGAPSHSLGLPSSSLGPPTTSFGSSGGPYNPHLHRDGSDSSTQAVPQAGPVGINSELWEKLSRLVEEKESRTAESLMRKQREGPGSEKSSPPQPFAASILQGSSKSTSNAGSSSDPFECSPIDKHVPEQMPGGVPKPRSPRASPGGGPNAPRDCAPRAPLPVNSPEPRPAAPNLQPTAWEEPKMDDYFGRGPGANQRSTAPVVSQKPSVASFQAGTGTHGTAAAPEQRSTGTGFSIGELKRKMEFELWDFNRMRYKSRIESLDGWLYEQSESAGPPDSTQQYSTTSPPKKQEFWLPSLSSLAKLGEERGDSVPSGVNLDGAHTPTYPCACNRNRGSISTRRVSWEAASMAHSIFHTSTCPTAYLLAISILVDVLFTTLAIVAEPQPRACVSEPPVMPLWTRLQFLRPFLMLLIWITVIAREQILAALKADWLLVALACLASCLLTITAFVML